MAVNRSPSEAGQASTMRPTRPGESSAIRTPTEHPKDPPTTVTGSALESSRLRAAPATCSASAARRSAARLAGPKAFWTGIVV